MVIGLGALATGSGAVFSSAAFSNSAASSADLRVVVDQSLRVERGDGFGTGQDKYTDNPTLFDGESPNDSSGGPFEDGDTPLAYVNDGVNDDLVMKAAVDVADGDGVRFENLIKISNDTTGPVDMGIAYDRGAGQYGSDIGSNDLSYDLAQRVYRFEINGDNLPIDYPGDGSGPQISPQSGEEGVRGNNSSIKTNGDRPNAAVRIDEGNSIGLDLVVDINDSDRDEIRDQVPQLSDPGQRTDTVDILDEITVGRFEGLSLN